MNASVMSGFRQAHRPPGTHLGPFLPWPASPLRWTGGWQELVLTRPSPVHCLVTNLGVLGGSSDGLLPTPRMEG